MHDIPWLNTDEAYRETKRSVFDYSKLFLEALSAVSFAASFFTQKPGLAWAYFASAFLLASAVFLPAVRDEFRKRSESAKDETVARGAFPELRKYARQFAAFVDTRTSDTLHYMAHGEVCQGHGGRYQQLAMPDIGLWNAQIDFFIRRIDSQRPSMSELRIGIEQLHFIVGSYNNQCVSLIFDRLPQDLQSTLTPRAKANLNSFQQRFEIFLAGYENWGKELSASRPTLNSLPRCFGHSRPLV